MAKHSGDVVFRERPETIVSSPPHATSSGLFFSAPGSRPRLSPLNLESKAVSETPPLSPQTQDKKKNLPDMDHQSKDGSSPAPPATLQKRKASFNFTPHKDYARVSENPLYDESQQIDSVSPIQRETTTPQRVQTPLLRSPIHRSSTPRTPLADLDSGLTKNLFLGSPNSPTFADKLYAEVRKQSPILMIGPGSPTFSLLPPPVSTPDSPDSLFARKAFSSITNTSQSPRTRVATRLKENVSPLSSPTVVALADSPLKPAGQNRGELSKEIRVIKQVESTPPVVVIPSVSPSIPQCEVDHADKMSESSDPPISRPPLSKHFPVALTSEIAAKAATIPKLVIPEDVAVIQQDVVVLPEDVAVPSGRSQDLAAFGKMGLAFFLVTAAILSSENRVFLPSAVWEEAHVVTIRGALRRSEIPQQLSVASTGLRGLWTPFDPKRDVGGPDWRWNGLGLGCHIRPALRVSKQVFQILRAGFADISFPVMATDHGSLMTSSSKHSSQAVRDAAHGVQIEGTSVFDPQSGQNSQQQDADKGVDASSSASQDNRASAVDEASGEDSCRDATRMVSVPDTSVPALHSEAETEVLKEVDMSGEQKGDSVVDATEESDKMASSVLASESQALESEDTGVNTSPVDTDFLDLEAAGKLVDEIISGAESMAGQSAPSASTGSMEGIPTQAEYTDMDLSHFDTWEPRADGRDAVEEDHGQAVEHVFPSVQDLAEHALAIALTLLLLLSGLLFLVLKMAKGKQTSHEGADELETEGDVTSVSGVPDSKETMQREELEDGEVSLPKTPVRNVSGSAHAEEVEMMSMKSMEEFGSFEAYKRAINAKGNVVVTPVRRSARIHKGQSEASPAARSLGHILI